MKACKTCGEVSDNFQKCPTGKDGLAAHCRPCMRKKEKIYKDSRRANAREWVKKSDNSKKVRIKSLLIRAAESTGDEQLRADIVEFLKTNLKNF